MRVLIVSPHPMTMLSGNVVTVRRYQKNLTRRGHKVQVVVPPSDERAELLDDAIDSFRPDVLHWYHAYRTGRFLPRLRRAGEVPSVVSLGGTDLNQDRLDPERERVMTGVFELAQILLVVGESMDRLLRERFPRFSGKIRSLPKGVEVGERPVDLGLSSEEVLILLPGGIRPVKNNLFAVTAMDPLAEADPRIRLLLAGPVIDPDYGRRVLEEVGKRPWARHHAGIPHESIGTAMKRAAVVLNTSESEGLANALLEAMACGRPILASNIPSNRGVIEEGVTGLLYRGEADFREKLARLLRDPGRLGEQAAEQARKTFSSLREAEELEKCYEAAINGRR